MTTFPAAAFTALALFEPPYQQLVPCLPAMMSDLNDVAAWKGRALVWMLNGESYQLDYYEALRNKPLGLPLFVLLPPPIQIREVLDLLPLARFLCPRMFLPSGLLDAPTRLRQILSTPPRSVPSTLTHYLVSRGLLNKRKARREFFRIVELAPETRSISALSRRMYTSRRTLGRHFISTGIPVPSHCLHFARLFHVALQLQSDDSAMFRIASRFGYADGFTMSNQMNRMIGCRPSEVRTLLGWEWVIEAWLKREMVV